MDAGANLTYSNSKINFFGMYHSSKSAPYGLGINYQSIGVSGMYTTVTSVLGGYANGNFEISLQMRLDK